MARIFISYSRKDQDFALRLSSDLERLGQTIWLDKDAIPAGMKWSTAIQQGLDSAELLIVILSPDSIASTNVEDEWQYFLDEHKPLIPVLWKPARIHFQLSRIQFINFHNQEYDKALQQLQLELNRKLAGQTDQLTSGSEAQTHAYQPSMEPVPSANQTLPSSVAAGSLLLFLLSVLWSAFTAATFVRTAEQSLILTGLAVASIGSVAAFIPLLGLRLIGKHRLARLPFVTWKPLLVLQVVVLVLYLLIRAPLLDVYANTVLARGRQEALANHAQQTGELLMALALLSPERARILASEYNDKGVDATANNDLVHARTYLEAVKALDGNENLDIGRDQEAKSIARYNLGQLREYESDPQAAVTIYREAITLNDANIEARYALSSLLFIDHAKDPAALDEAIALANSGWKNYIPETLCRGKQNLDAPEIFQKAWHCFALKTTEAGARLIRNNAAKGDTAAVIESLSQSAVNLAQANSDFRKQGYFSAEAYYDLAIITAPATEHAIICGILANLDPTNPRHRVWADYANEQLKLAGTTCSS